MKAASSGNHSNLYFLTFAVGGWKHLFANEACARIALESLAWYRERGKLGLYGFVLLPSHLHALAAPLTGTMKGICDAYSAYTSQRMISALDGRGRRMLMHYFHDRPGASDTIWQEARIEEIRGGGEAWRRLAWMHAKPLRPEWALAVTPEEYPFSSACFYANGRMPVLAVDDLNSVFPTEVIPPADR